jgi:serine/threonine protein kinase
LISDFGTSRWQNDDATVSDPPGSIHYAAPEMYIEDAPFTPKCDVFSFELILFEILSGVPVFQPDELPFPIIRRLRNSELATIPTGWSPVMRKVIHQCWQQNPSDRPSFWQIFAMFQDNNFELLPGAESETIREFCNGVLEWERKAGIPQ